MGDQETQTQQEPPPWASAASPHDLASLPAFDEPLQWPDATAWEQLFEGDAGPSQPLYVPEDFAIDLLLDADVPADHGGGPPTEAHLEPLPSSIWAPDPAADHETATVDGATMAALGGAATTVPAPVPAAMDEPRSGPRAAGPAWMQRLQIRHGSAAVVALACCVSLVLLGMFLSVRARDNLPTETSQFGPTTDQLATQGPSSSLLPPSTAATTTTAAPAPAISLSDIAAEAAGAEGSGTTETTARTSTPATTAAPSRATAPAGGSGESGSQPTNTTAAPQPAPTSPPTTEAPPEDTTTTPTTARPVRPTVPDYSIPTFTLPSWPSSTSGTPLRATDN